jgi:3,4-dihydroxy 2-butanone 4-phosphate synthase/GTP cyclohydrolase II
MKMLVESRLPSKWGEYVMVAFGEEGDRYPHVVLHRNLEKLKPGRVPLRIHSECMTGDLFASRRCDCGAQLVAALDHFKQNGGLLIYLRQEGRGIGLVEKLRAYNLQDEGLDTFEANVARGHAEDAREYDAAVAILRQLGVESVGLLTNNPHKVKALENAGVEVDRIAVAVGAHQDNAAYLKAKADIAGHWL